MTTSWGNIESHAKENKATQTLLDNPPKNQKERILKVFDPNGEITPGSDLDTTLGNSADAIYADLEAKYTQAIADYRKLIDTELAGGTPFKYFNTGTVADGDQFIMDEYTGHWAYANHPTLFDAGDITGSQVNAGTYAWNEGSGKFVLQP